jgi:hypothetical protein
MRSQYKRTTRLTPVTEYGDLTHLGRPGCLRAALVLLVSAAVIL